MTLGKASFDGGNMAAGKRALSRDQVKPMINAQGTTQNLSDLVKQMGTED